jgi:hypothetical protein
MNNIMKTTTYNQNGIEAEKFVEDMTSSAYQEYQKVCKA